MTHPEDDLPADVTDEQLAAELAQYDEALRVAAAPPALEGSGVKLPPEARRRLERAQAGLWLLKQARPGDASGSASSSGGTSQRRPATGSPAANWLRVEGYEVLELLGRGG